MKTCIVIADRSRARLFVGARTPERHGANSPARELLELDALMDPEGELTGGQLFSETRSGTNRSPHGAAFEYDDRREGHRDEQERRFARRIAAWLEAHVRVQRPHKVVLAVEPRLLGLLRHELEGSLHDRAEVIELARDFSRRTPQQVYEALLRHGLLNKAS